MNGKQELIDKLMDVAEIKCASIKYRYEYGGADCELIVLKLDYSMVELSEFSNSLDFEYNSNFGVQELFGIVWLKDNTWLSRCKHDGSEWWHHNLLPSIPIECKR